MKYTGCYLLFILGFIAQTVAAQTQIQTRTITRSVTRSTPLDTNQTAFDENGNELRYYQYQKLLNTGNYSLIRDNGLSMPVGKFRLKKLSEAEHYKMYERIKPLFSNKSPMLQEGKQLDVAPLLEEAATKDELEGKVIILVFWYADCPPCTESFESLNDFFKQIYNPEKVMIMAITRDNDLKVAAKLKDKPLNYTRFINSAGKVTNAYQSNRFPAFVVTDRDHIIRFSMTGISPITISEFKDCIRSFMLQ